jgi:endonuclease YncB( thermonuclease family)
VNLTKIDLLLLLALFALPLVTSAHPGGVDENGCHRDSRNGKQHCHADRAKANGKPRYDAANPPKAGDEAVFYGPFVSVVDGDTFKAKVQGVVMDFRLEGIDAPERNQPHGEQARQALLAMIGGRQLVLVPSDTDRYGRTIVRVWAGKLDVNREMVKRGAAWFDSEYSKDASSVRRGERRSRSEARPMGAGAQRSGRALGVEEERKIGLNRMALNQAE